MARQIDALKVISDPAYAASLTTEEWAALQFDAQWEHLITEYADVVNYAVGEIRPAAQIAPPIDNPGARQTAFKYLGTRPPRVQGMGVVSDAGLYAQNINKGSELFMLTLRSPHPHARVRSVDAADAEKLPGVALIMHRFN